MRRRYKFSDDSARISIIVVLINTQICCPLVSRTSTNGGQMDAFILLGLEKSDTPTLSRLSVEGRPVNVS